MLRIISKNAIWVPNYWTPKNADLRENPEISVAEDFPKTFNECKACQRMNVWFLFIDC